MRETRLVSSDLQPRYLGFYNNCGILTFPVLFHAGTWQSVETTASIVSTIRPMRHRERALGSCQGGSGQAVGSVQADRMRRVTWLSGVGLGRSTGEVGLLPLNPAGPRWHSSPSRRLGRA